jgi:integrase
MKGHIRKRGNAWAIIINHRWFTFHGSKREAQVKCAELIAAHKAKALAAPGRETVAAFLERWLDHVRTQVSPASHNRYARTVAGNINPHIGSLSLSKLGWQEITKMQADLLDSGLSPKTVKFIRTVLRGALQQALPGEGRWNLIAINPAALVKAPKVEKRKMQVLDVARMTELLERARDSELYIPCLLAIACGLRRGEIAALRWRSVDLSARRLHVVASVEQIGKSVREKETKSGRERSVVLPGFAIEPLRQHKRQQAESLLRYGVRQGDDGHVCTRADGSGWEPLAMTKAFGALLKGSGIKRLHDLRHSFATAMLGAGVNLKVVGEALGHSQISVTADTYSHVSETMQADAADRLDAAFRRQRK